MDSTSPEPKSRSEKMASASPEQQLPDRSSADKRSRASSSIAEPVDPTDSPSVPATRQQPARSAKSGKSDIGDQDKLTILSDDEVKTRRKKETLTSSAIAPRGERRSPFCSTCVKQCLKGKGTTCYDRVGSRSDRCWNCSTHTCINLNAELWAQFKVVYKEVSDQVLMFSNTLAKQDVQAFKDKDRVDLLLKRIATFETEIKIERKSPKKEDKKKKKKAESPGMIMSSSEAEEIDLDDFYDQGPMGQYQIDRFNVSSGLKKPPIPPDETPKRRPSGKVSRKLSFSDRDLLSPSEPRAPSLRYKPSSEELHAATRSLHRLNYYQREKLRRKLSTDLLALDAIDRSEAA
jgi:hypothetical protein